jgi:hypothetical protein
MGLSNNPDYWRKRAEETLARVEHWPECDYKQTIFEVATTFERMADAVERRLEFEKGRYH